MGSREIPPDGKKHEETSGGGLFGASRGFPWREGFVGDESVAQNARVQIECAADPQVETVLIGPMRPIPLHQAETDGVDHSGSGRDRQERPPTPVLLIRHPGERSEMGLEIEEVFSETGGFSVTLEAHAGRPVAVLYVERRSESAC